MAAPQQSFGFDERRSSRFLLGALFVVSVVSLLIIWPFLTGTIFALVLAYLLHGPFNRLVKVVRSRAFAAAILVFGVVLAVVVPVVFIGWEILKQARALADAGAGGTGFRDSIVEFLGGLGVPPDQARDLLAQAIEGATALLKASAVPTLGALASLAANIGIFVFLLYFLLVGGEALLSLIQQAMPLEPSRREHLLATIGARVRALFLGTFLVALLQGVAAGLGWWLFGFPSPVFWGFVMTILAVIPAIGPILVMLPAGLIALAQGNVVAGVGIILYGLVVVGLLDNIARPYIVGRSTDVHAGIVLLGTLGGLTVFGATGFIIGPLVLSLVGPLLLEWEALRPGPG